METIDEPPSQDLLILLANIDSSFLIGSGIALFILLFFSAIISGSEVAFFSLNSSQIEECRENSTKNKHLLHLLKNPRQLLATILIFNNLVNVAIVTLSTVLMWEISDGSELTGMYTLITTVVVTFAIVFFGEVIPKVFALQNNLSLAKKTAGILRVIQFISSPLSLLLMKISATIENRVEQKGYQISIDEMNQALELTTAHTETTEEERDILKGIVNFGTLTVTQVMRSRIDITAVDHEIDFHELMDKINKSGFSRIPVFDETIDQLLGVIYVKDLLPFIDKDETFKWQELIRPGFYIPDTKKVDSLLKDFQAKRIHMAIVVDEYGGTSGLITLEDVIEEIIGEINDEFDEEDIVYNKVDENTFVFEGKTLLNDVCRIIEIEPSVFEKIKGDSETLGGLILELNSKLPSVGEKITFEQFTFTIVAVDNKRIKRIKLIKENIE